jgi:2'-5' RNA ligase
MAGTRAFIALDFDDAFLDAAEAVGPSLALGLAPRIKVRWVPKPLMHLTLRFFAALDAPLVDAIAARIPELGSGRTAVAIAVDARRLVAFPEARRGRVIALELDAPALHDLVAAAEAMLAEIGLPAETRPFHPHLTIGRLREPADLRQLVERAPLALAGHALALTFYESKLGPKGPAYRVLARSELVR